MPRREKQPEPGGVARLRAEVTKLTADYRVRADGPFPRIRELVTLRGIDPARSFMVQLHTEDTNVLLGIVVSATRRVFLFMFDFLHFPIERGEFREWTELTALPTHFEYRAFAEQIECGISLARELPLTN